MITFILYTVLFILSTGSLAKILHFSIQPGQWLDSLFNWQKRLFEWDLKGYVFMSKAGGNCEMCFSHIIALWSFIGYAIFMNLCIGEWVTNTSMSWISISLINFIWYLAYVALSTIVNTYFITKLFR